MKDKLFFLLAGLLPALYMIAQEATFQVGRFVLHYLMQHVDYSRAREYNMLVNTFVNKINDPTRKNALKSLLIPLPVPGD